jgi:hypothetical protein
MKYCILCGGPAARSCWFIPNKGSADRFSPVKLKRGKTRTIWYTLCESCCELPDQLRNARVERVMEDWTTSQRN